MTLFESYDVSSVAGFELDGAVGGRGSCAELSRLADGPAGELRAADAGREAEIVLDPARRSGLAAQRSALDDQRVEPLGGTVDRSGEAGGPGAHDQQVDFLARRELAADPERAQQLASRWVQQLDPAGEPNEWGLRSACRLVVLPAEWEPVRANEVQHLHRPRGCARSDDLEADSFDALERLSPGDEGREDEVAKRTVVEQQRAQCVAVNRDVAQRFFHDRVHKDCLPREKVQLAEKARGPVSHDLVSVRVDDCDFALKNGYEGIDRVSDPVQHVVDGRGPLFAQSAESRQLRGRERGDRGNAHSQRVTLALGARRAAARTNCSTPSLVASLL